MSWNKDPAFVFETIILGIRKLGVLQEVTVDQIKKENCRRNWMNWWTLQTPDMGWLTETLTGVAALRQVSETKPESKIERLRSQTQQC